MSYKYCLCGGHMYSSYNPLNVSNVFSNDSLLVYCTLLLLNECMNDRFYIPRLGCFEVSCNFRLCCFLITYATKQGQPPKIILEEMLAV